MMASLWCGDEKTGGFDAKIIIIIVVVFSPLSSDSPLFMPKWLPLPPSLKLYGLDHFRRRGEEEE